MNIKRTILVSVTWVLIVLLVACTTAKEEQPILPGSEWRLISLRGSALIEDTEITLNFEQEALEGSAGCNRYGGNYTTSEDRLQLDGLYATEMGCMEPEGVLEQESAYLDTLGAAARYQVDGEQLKVYDEAGVQILTFVAAGE